MGAVGEMVDHPAVSVRLDGISREHAEENWPRERRSGITGKQIATESGVHYGLIYHYFDLKEALFRAAMEEPTNEYIAHRDATVDRSEALPPLAFAGHELWWRAAANYSADGGASYSSLGWSYPVLTYELAAIRAAPRLW